ncbi:pentatricopeptide repeat-containing protein At2g33680 isoform X2 [Ziziphus jujuba]|uniref:Pentatricopeptide repeat-containing protein At2g33680 isoform X2 n=1 Tax=Ziziphus jujuba TaxID=326968 RepID=A0A6P6FL45_ZIZJJ|nr:pentatricopeptide repeat-containing protein At2g33680 isoform X2 [Ziziphus jujuba]
MNFSNKCSVFFTHKILLSAFSSWAGRLLSFSKNSVTKRSFHLLGISGKQKNSGFCFQDCVSLLQHLVDIRDPRYGKSVHSLCIKTGFYTDVFVQNNIMRFYANHGDLVNAHLLFEEIPEPNLVSCTSLISSYVHDGQYDNGLRMFSLMCRSGFRPNEFGFSVALKACRIMQEFVFGMVIHGQILKCGFESCSFCSSSILGIYVEWGDVEHAHKFFHGIPLGERSEASWNTLIDSYVQMSDPNEALNLFREMMHSGVSPNGFTYGIIIKLCANELNPELGRSIHAQTVKVGFEGDVIVGGALVDVYAKLGLLDDACQMFWNLEEKDNMVWCALLAGFHHVGDTAKGLNYYFMFLSEEMMQVGHMPSQSTVSYILRALANHRMLKQGRALHAYIFTSVSDSDCKMCTGNALIEMYAKCGAVDNAKMVFKAMTVPNEFSWTTIMSGFCQLGQFEEVLRLFRDMLSSLSAKPSQFTVLIAVQACMKLEPLDGGKQVHSYVIKVGFDSHPFVESSLVSMYSAFKNEIQNAFLVFSFMKERDLVSWCAMITACVQNGYYEEALKHFSEFRIAPNFSVDESILSSCLSACAGLAAIEMGKWFHACVIKTGFESHLHVASSIIDMYSKCGSIKEACQLFNKTEDQNLVTWTAMLSGYAHNGLGRESVELFSRMKEAGLKPDSITFVGVLTACSHAGLVEEGWQFFNSMTSDYGLEVNINHYACMVDLLGRAQQVEAAKALIEKAPFHLKSKHLLWKTLLGACNRHGNIEIGNRIAQMLVELKTNEPSTYVLLSNIYASASMWDNSVEVRSKMKAENVYKQPGSSWIQVAG